MLVVGFPAGPPQTNCWVIAPAAGEECVVLDPGIGAEDQLDEVLAAYRLRPVAVLLTHGHYDHTWAVTPVCGARGVPAYINAADRGQLTDPAAGMGLPSGTPVYGRLEWAEPDDVRLLTDGEMLRLAGLELQVELASGHTPGSVTFAAGAQLFTGDLLFAGSVGRTDLPGGSTAALLDSVSRVVLTRPDDTVCHPGHGPDTTVGAERATNPFLRGLATAPVRGV